MLTSNTARTAIGCWLAVTAMLVSGAQKRPPASGWLPDAGKAVIPQRPAAGRIHGEPFRVEKAQIDVSTPGKEKKTNHLTYWLELRQGKGFFADKQFQITLAVTQGTALKGMSVQVHPGSTFEQPGGIKEGNVTYSAVQGVEMQYKKPGQNLPSTEFGRDYGSGSERHYTLRLLLGPIKQGKLPGQIYLCMPDAQKSYVASTFIAIVEHLKSMTNLSPKERAALQSLRKEMEKPLGPIHPPKH